MLHGWGANAMDLASLVPLLNLDNYICILPNAPLPHPQVADGRMWYDIQNQHQGYEDSRRILQDWLTALPEITGIPLSRTLLSGFSQGGAMALDLGLTLSVAGVIVMSGYLHPVAATLQPPFPPILMLHGSDDRVVPLAMAEVSREQLLALGATVDYHVFEMGHEIRPQVLPLIDTFVQRQLPAPI